MSEIIQFLPVEDLIPQFVIAGLSEIEDWGLQTAGVPEAHKKTKGRGVTVAVLDTGGPCHPDLNDNLLPALNASRSNSVADAQGHGTHVAGIIAALANGFGVVGVAPEAHILPIKVLDDNGLSGFAEIEKGIRLATAAGVDVINMSLGAPIEPPTSLHDAIKEAAAKGIILVAAAGNDGGQVNWPARYDEVIAVAAVDKSGKIAYFSSHGDKIAVAGPGIDVYSTYLNAQYAQLSGTSQASPFIAGVCALVIAWLRANPSLPQVKSYMDMLHRLQDISDDAGHVGNLGFGIPSFANVDWAKGL